MSFQKWKPEFAKQIKDARIQRNLPQSVAAERIGVDRKTLWRLEDPCNESSPSLATLVRIMSFYGLEPEFLIKPKEGGSREL